MLTARRNAIRYLHRLHTDGRNNENEPDVKYEWGQCDE